MSLPVKGVQLGSRAQAPLCTAQCPFCPPSKYCELCFQGLIQPLLILLHAKSTTRSLVMVSKTVIVPHS
jgi:hypothetical protein